MTEAILVTDAANDIEWKEFLRNQYNLFFDHRFFSYNEVFEKGIKFIPLKIRDTNTGKIVSVILGCEKSVNGLKTYVSCDGVSFAGFLWKKRSDLLNYMDILSGFRNYLNKNGYSGCIIRSPPFLYNRAPNEETEYALIRSGFEVTSLSISNIIDLREFEFTKISETKKRSIKKSQKEINVRIVDEKLDKENFRKFYSILRDNRELKNISPTHSFEELMHLKNNLPNEIILFEAEVQGETAAVCVLFAINSEIILNFYLAGSEKYKLQGVSEYILYKSIEWSKSKGYVYYDIGTSDTKDGLIEGLFAFKKKFLANGYLRKTFELKLN